MPDTTPYLMPDISKWNGNAGLSAAAAKQVATVAKAIMVKATEDKTYTFGAYASSILHAVAAGLGAAAYHFVGNSPGADQAHHVWSVVQRSGVSAICIDWEGGSRAVALELHATLKTLAGPHDIKVGAYEGSWAREHGGGLPGCDFTLIPAYGGSTLNPSYKQDPYAGWQYTNGTTNGTKMPSEIPGIGHCDVSVIERPELLGFKVAPAKPVHKPPVQHPGHAPSPFIPVMADAVKLATEHYLGRKKDKRPMDAAAIAKTHRLIEAASSALVIK